MSLSIKQLNLMSHAHLVEKDRNPLKNVSLIKYNR